MSPVPCSLSPPDQAGALRGLAPTGRVTFSVTEAVSVPYAMLPVTMNALNVSRAVAGRGGQRKT